MSTLSRPAERIDRVLDAATDLLVRWGYQRVTIEEVARHAGIGKGTVYLHFRTKEALFLTVLLRAHHGVVAGMIDRIRADPAEALPSRMLRSVFLALAEDPVVRRLYLGDSEILGRLAHEAADTLGELAQRRAEIGRAWFGLLRDAGLLRTDLDVSAQLYLLSAVNNGFYFVESLPSPTTPGDPARRADVLRHALAASLEAPGAPAPGAATAEAVAELFASLIEHIDDEWQRRLR
ncbi:TetR/AcrR family transcriptional regulator [Pseudonocardia acidicola]|uniref:TetR/AcrR family transcriptional regulator n=1 Tax=Pseudonocardia acidicola TaxID=2724939 RepID=A0ABX1SF76_9PSEU|nr:TetR/AcrR family transcriptional regulator [Pseudonocardia acidicola]NMH99031.1 TetR/AcrR family transcriptional regulator [Pseudonocardia acidicola]